MELRFGFMSPPLAEQLAGVGLEPEELAQFEKDKDAILRLHLRGMIGDSRRDVAFRRLVREIEKAAHR